MTPKNDCICPNAECRADLKEAGITMRKRVYVNVMPQNGNFDFGKSKNVYFDAFCKKCREEIKDKAILQGLKKGWCEVAHL